MDRKAPEMNKVKFENVEDESNPNSQHESNQNREIQMNHPNYDLIRYNLGTGHDRSENSLSRLNSNQEGMDNVDAQGMYDDHIQIEFYSQTYTDDLLGNNSKLAKHSDSRELCQKTSSDMNNTAIFAQTISRVEMSNKKSNSGVKGQNTSNIMKISLNDSVIRDEGAKNYVREPNEVTSHLNIQRDDSGLGSSHHQDLSSPAIRRSISDRSICSRSDETNLILAKNSRVSESYKSIFAYPAIEKPHDIPILNNQTFPSSNYITTMKEIEYSKTTNSKFTTISGFPPGSITINHCRDAINKRQNIQMVVNSDEPYSVGFVREHQYNYQNSSESEFGNQYQNFSPSEMDKMRWNPQNVPGYGLINSSIRLQQMNAMNIQNSFPASTMPSSGLLEMHHGFEFPTYNTYIKTPSRYPHLPISSEPSYGELYNESNNWNYLNGKFENPESLSEGSRCQNYGNRERNDTNVQYHQHSKPINPSSVVNLPSYVSESKPFTENRSDTNFGKSVSDGYKISNTNVYGQPPQLQVTDNKLNQGVTRSQPVTSKNTMEGTKTALRRFRKWFNDKYGILVDLNTITKDNAPQLLKEFFSEIKDTRPGRIGNEYEPVTLTTYRNGIRRYFLHRECPPAPDNFDLTGSSFSSINRSLILKKDTLRLKTKGISQNLVEFTTDEQIERMWATGAIGINDPTQLLRLLWWVNSMYHGVKGRVSHHNLKIEDFIVFTNSKGLKCIKLQKFSSSSEVDEQIKQMPTQNNILNFSGINHQMLDGYGDNIGQLLMPNGLTNTQVQQQELVPPIRKRRKPTRIVESNGHPERDLVLAFEIFRRHRPHGISSFYLTPKTNPTGDIWYNKVPMGKNSIGRIMYEIKCMSGKA